jgi:Glyoxalase/Bleomycin resistance protein/Dioxygenase superfamily
VAGKTRHRGSKGRRERRRDSDDQFLDEAEGLIAACGEILVNDAEPEQSGSVLFSQGVIPTTGANATGGAIPDRFARRDPVPISSSARCVRSTMIKRLDTLDVATTGLADAASVYEKNFGFTVTRSADGKSASVKVGGAEIRLVAGASIDSSGEGMIGLWLEADDVDRVIADFRAAGLDAGTIQIESGRRILAIDPKLANQVPLFIFDRRG